MQECPGPWALGMKHFGRSCREGGEQTRRLPRLAVEMEGSATAPIRGAHAWKCVVVKGGVPRVQRAYL